VVEHKDRIKNEIYMRKLDCEALQQEITNLQKKIAADVAQTKNAENGMEFLRLCAMIRKHTETIKKLKGKLLHGIVVKTQTQKISRQVEFFKPTTRKEIAETPTLLKFDGYQSDSTKKDLYMFGGLNCDASSPLNQGVWRFTRGVWQHVPTLDCPTSFHAMETMKGCGYLIGGDAYNRSNFVDGVVRFGFKSDKFLSLDATVPPLHEARVGFSTATLNGSIYVLGGIAKKSVECYDPERNTWEFVGETNLVHWEGVAVASGLGIYLFGGNSKSNRIEYYSPHLNQWILGPSLPVRLTNMQAVVVGKYIYLSGGLSYDATTPSASFVRFDPAEDEWKTLADMSYPRYGHSMMLVDGVIHVFGGLRTKRAEKNHPLYSVERYNTSKYCWERVKEMVLPRGNAFFSMGWL